MKRSRISRILMMLSAVALLAVFFPTVASAQAPPTVTVSESYSGLEPLGAGFLYEGWLIIDGAPVSTGTFSIDASGAVVPVTTADIPNAADAATFVLTIEPSPDPDPAPADTHVLAGDFVDGVATLSIGHPAALATDFSTATGSYIVATPTTADTSDEYSGIWFLELPGGAPPPGPSLDLPTLPAGWQYEGWTVAGGTPISTGTFLSASGSDNFGGFSGPDPAPPFPGEDFIVNPPAGLTFPRDVSGYPVVISVEPFPDDSPAPFALKPLTGQVPDPVVTGADVSNPLEFSPDNLGGTVSLTDGCAIPIATEPEIAFTGADSDDLAILGMTLIALGAMAAVGQRRFAREI